jgi:hypothetical protein
VYIVEKTMRILMHVQVRDNKKHKFNCLLRIKGFGFNYMHSTSSTKIK